MKFSETTKLLVLERAKGKCELCGLPASNFQLHHRRPRGMGGSKKKETGDAANALLVHSKCHAWIESNRKQAMEFGYLVSQYANPKDVPLLRSQEWVLLSEDGSFSVLTNPHNLEHQTTNLCEFVPKDCVPPF